MRFALLRLTAYYALLGLAVWLLATLIPVIPSLLERFRELSALGGGGSTGFGMPSPDVSELAALSPGEWGFVTFLSMCTALLLVLPVAWVYMFTKQKSGYDQSVVQTVIILPMVVAGTVILIQNSLALAFALAAIVAAVRFRNTLEDTKDAVYIFLALAVGVAAGVFSPMVAAVMSLMFNLVVLGLWWFNVGNIYADQLHRTPRLPPAEGLLGPRRRSSAAFAVGDPELLAALAPDELEEVADRAARLQAYIMAREGDKKGDRFHGLLLVHSADAEVAQRIVEAVLPVHSRRWRLAEIVPAEHGRSTLEYLLRLRDDFPPAGLLTALKTEGAGTIDAVEYRSLRGLKRRAEA